MNKAIRRLLFPIVLLSIAGCDTTEPALSPEQFEGTWINESPDLADVGRVCRIDIVMYIGGYRVKRWNPGEHVQQVWTEFPLSDELSVQWAYSVSIETLDLKLLSTDRMEAIRIHDFEEDRFTDQEWVEYFVKQ